MSARKFLEHLACTPTAYILIANGVWGCAESETVVALFDTKSMAIAYAEASRLPGVMRTNHGNRTISRSQRPDSLLWEFNRPRVTRAPIGIDYRGTPVNPAPPSGPLEITMFDGLAPESVATVEGWP